MISPEDLNNVVKGLLSSADAEALRLALPLAELDSVQRALEAIREGEPEDFHFHLIYPLSQAIDGLLASELVSEEARFLVKHSRFVDSHFERLIRQFEGNACCADKSRTILRRLLTFYTTGLPIVFDYTQKFTFHLPKHIFAFHEDIVMFFEGLHSLYYGNPDKYLKALAEITSKAKASVDAAETRWLAGMEKPNTVEPK